MSRYGYGYIGAPPVHGGGGFSAWKYVGWAFVLAAWGALVFLNVRAAFAFDMRLSFQIGTAAILAVVDAAVIAFMMGAFEEHAAGRPSRAVGCVILWLACSAGECAGAYSSLLDYTGAATAPVARSEDERQGAIKDLATEESNLADIRKQLGATKLEERLASLSAREKASLGRIADLRPKTYASTVVTVHAWYVGLEAYVIGTLWLLSQIAVFVLTGSLHGAPQPVRIAVAPGRPAARPVADFEDVEPSGHWSPDSIPLPRPAAPDTPAGHRAGQPDIAPDSLPGIAPDAPDGRVSGAPDTLPDTPPMVGHPIDRTRKDTVRPAPVRSPDRLRLAVVRTPDTAPDSRASGQPDNSAKAAIPDTPDVQPDTFPDTPDTAPRTLPSGVTAAHYRQIADYYRAQFSIRQIMDKTGLTKWQVTQVRDMVKDATTKGREKA